MRRFALEFVHRLAAIICLASAYQFAVTKFDTTWLLVTALAALVVATGPAYWVAAEINPQPLAWPQRRDWSRLVPGWALMILAAGCKIAKLPPQVALWVWLVGLAWLLWGARQLSKPSSLAQRPTPRSISVWALVILVAAAAPRVWKIDSVPRYVHCDEGATIITGLQFFNDPNHDWFGPQFTAGTLSLTFALGAAGAWLGGFNLPAGRAPDVVLGALSVVLLFDGLWRVSNVPVAVVSALLLAANHSHLAFSRIASGYIQTAFVVSLIFATFARVWTAPSYLNSAALGIATAVGVQTYRASTAALPLLLGAMTLLVLLHPRRRRTWLVPFVIFAVSGAATSAPAAVTYWQQWGPLNNRSDAIIIFTDYKMNQLKRDVYHTDSTAAVVAHQAWNSLRGFHVGEDHQPQYGSLKPMADPYTAALMVPGALLVLLGLRQFVAINALVFTVGYLWLALGLHWAPGFNRATGALPLGMVLPAIALVQCWGTLWAGRARWLGWARAVCLLGAVALCVAANLQIYFVDYVYSRARGDEPSEAGWLARRYAAQYTVHLVNWPLPGHEGLRLIIGGWPISLRPNEPSVDYVRKAEVNGSDLFIISSHDEPARDALLARFPDARLETWRPDSIHGPILFLVFVGQPRVAEETPNRS